MSQEKRRSSPVSRKKSQPSQAAHVGIIFVVDDRVLIESSQLSEAELCAGFVNYPHSHEQYWSKLEADGVVPRGEDYGQTPRGRVVHAVQSGQYRLFLDPCILRNRKLVREICKRLNLLDLPAGSLEILTDGHYRCAGCLGDAE